MSDSEETKPDANQLVTCKLEFEAHDEDISDPTVDIKPSIEQTTTRVHPNLILDSSDDEEFTEELLCCASGASFLPEDSSERLTSPDLEEDKTLIPIASGGNRDETSGENLDEDFTGELLKKSKHAFVKPKPLSCYLCKKEFVHNRDLLIHWQTHKSSTKSCNICGKSFVNMILLNKHSMVHFDKNAENPFVCKKCDCTFTQKQDFISHMLFFKHGENRIFKCDICRGFFVNEKDLKLHLATHVKPSKALRCEECGEYFQKQTDLRNHMVNHIGERIYKCDLCNLTFKSKFVLSKHQEVMHASTMVCSICNLSFSMKDKRNYDFHVKLHSK